MCKVYLFFSIYFKAFIGPVTLFSCIFFIAGSLNFYKLVKSLCDLEQCCTVHALPQVAEYLPVQWFSGLKGQQTLPQLEPFCRYLTHLANSLHRGSVGGSDSERRTAR